MLVCNSLKTDNVVFLLTIFFGFQLSACSDVAALDEGNRDKTIRREQEQDDKKQDIDWGLVAIADGSGAALGAELARYSGNLLVKFASAVGVGAYASYSEYERQKEDIEKNRDKIIFDRPNSINMDHPFKLNFFERNPDLLLKGSAILDTVGIFHNQIVTEMYENMTIDFSKYSRDIFVKFNALSLEQFGLFYSESNLKDIERFYDEEVYVEQKGWINYWNSIFESSSMYDASVWKTKRIEVLRDYIKKIGDTVQSDDELPLRIALTVAYYSRCLWNTVAPDPATAEECIIWSSDKNELLYLCGRNNVIEYKLSNRQYRLYPYYDAEGIRALYLYTNRLPCDLQYVCIDKELSEPSFLYDDLKTQIPVGKYHIEETACNDVYVIRIR